MARQKNGFGVARETWLTVRLAKTAAALLLTIGAASSHAQLVPPPLTPPPSPPSGTNTTSGATTTTTAPAPTPAPPPVSTPPAQSAAPPPAAPPACGWKVSPNGVPWYDTCYCHNTDNTTGSAFYAYILVPFIPVTLSTGQVVFTSHCYGGFADTAQGACDLLVSQAQAVGDGTSPVTAAPAPIGNLGHCNFVGGGQGSLIQYRAVPNAHPTCPANMSGSPCACNAGFMPNPNGAQGCVPETYTLVLQGGASAIEPWNKLHDPGHSKSNILFMAIVLDSKGMPKPGVPVTISSDVTSDSGGHQHTVGRPKGKLHLTQTGMANAASMLNGATDSTGLLAFYFGAEEASGEHELSATCDRCTNSPTQKVNVEIKGLGRLGDDGTSHQFFHLRGGRPWHPDNHYYSTEALGQIVWLAFNYWTQFQRNIPPAQRKPLEVNDSSLIKGGVFDVAQNWGPKHKGHRKGVVVDINNYSTENLLFEDFVEKYSYGNDAVADWEDEPPHFHIELLGRDE